VNYLALGFEILNDVVLNQALVSGVASIINSWSLRATSFDARLDRRSWPASELSGGFIFDRADDRRENGSKTSSELML
jgi:hypothetical protein